MIYTLDSVKEKYKDLKNILFNSLKIDIEKFYKLDFSFISKIVPVYKNNVKGRDYFDFLYLSSKNIKINMVYLKNKLIENKKIHIDNSFNLETLKRLLKERFESVDFDLVKKDVKHFIFNNDNLDYFNKDLFISYLDSLKV